MGGSKHVCALTLRSGIVFVIAVVMLALISLQFTSMPHTQGLIKRLTYQDEHNDGFTKGKPFTQYAGPGLVPSPESCSSSDIHSLASGHMSALIQYQPVTVGKIRFVFGEVADGMKHTTKYSIKAEFFARSKAEKSVSEVFNLVLAQEKTHGIVLDVGMNLGFYTLLSASMGYEVHSFELQPHCMKFMSRAALKNNVGHLIHPHVGPVAEKSIRIKQRLDVCKSGTYDTNKQETWYGKRGFRHEKLVSVRLDDVVHACGIRRIALVKMDVDGAEISALRSFVATLRSGIIRNMVLEIGGTESGAIVGSSKDEAEEVFTLIFGVFPYIYRESELHRWMDGEPCTTVLNWENMLNGGNILLRQTPLPCNTRLSV